MLSEGGSLLSAEKIGEIRGGEPIGGQATKGAKAHWRLIRAAESRDIPWCGRSSNGETLRWGENSW